MKRKVFIHYLRGEIDLKTFLDIVKEDPSLSLALKGVVPQEALQDENNAYWKKRDYDTLFRALQNGKESKRQIPETVEGDAAQGMKTIEEFLMHCTFFTLAELEAGYSIAAGEDSIDFDGTQWSYDLNGNPVKINCAT